MKSIALVLALFISMGVFAQSDTTNIEQYCQIVASQKAFTKKVNVYLDFGQQQKLYSTKNTAILGDSDKPKVFNSVVDAINFMGLKGWTMVNAFPISIGNMTVYHYLFKRRCTKDELEKLRSELENMTTIDAKD